MYNDVMDVYQILDTELFKILSENIRIELLKYLSLNGEKDIKEISNNFPQDRSVISRHLQQMERIGIVKVKKKSRRMIYSINGKMIISKLEKIVNELKEIVPDCCP